MPKKSEKSSNKRPAENTGAPNDLSNSKQKRRSGHGKVNSTDKQESMSTFDRNTRSNVQRAVSARFVEDDDVVEMVIKEKNDELLGNGTDTDNEPEDGEIDQETEYQDVIQQEELTQNDGVMASDSGTVSFNNNAAAQRESYEKNDLDLTEVEEKSMMKLARFLQKNGFI